MKLLFQSMWLLGLVILSCIPVRRDSSSSDVIDISGINIDLSDSTMGQVFQAQNDQDIPRLIQFIHSSSTAIRYLAAQALGSVRDSSASDTLAYLLDDANVYVAAAAGYSLGLMGSARSQPALLNAFRQYDTAGINSPVNSAILEAIGRLGTVDFLQAMATVETYQPDDTLLLLGQMRGIYRYMLRGLTDAAGTNTAIRYLSDKVYPEEVRLIAAHYLARAKDLDYTALSDQILAAYQNETAIDLRLPLITSVGKTKSETAWTILGEIIQSEQDSRIVANAIRSLSNFDYSRTKPIVLAALRNKDLHIASAAINYLNDFGRVADAGEYRNIARENLPWQTKISLLGIANKNYSYAYGITKGNINAELKSIFGRSSNISEKMACLKALAADPKNYAFILETGRQSSLPAIQSAVMESGVEMLKSKYFGSAFGNGDAVKRDILSYINEHLSKGDVAALEIIESMSKDPMPGLKNLIDIPGIEQIKTNLASDPYAQYMLGKTINTLKATATPLAPMNNYKKWSVAEFSLKGASSYADIITDKGTIRLRFLKGLAPATVLNFVQLAKTEFFNGKNFHRVVPNFVIQGGCPRGDGYGSMDYSIRTETPQVYYNKAGLVGMASSGPHTESCQFFITHSPTPHLDGNYTIFAEVVNGMDVVNQIQIGDKIQRVNLTE